MRKIWESQTSLVRNMFLLTQMSLFFFSQFEILCPESEEDSDTAGKVDYAHFWLHWK